jgi:hypothetical protein
VTNDGIGPGGNISAIVYSDYIDKSGWPKTQGVPWNQYFTKEYYRKEVPIWESYAPGLFSDTRSDPFWYVRLSGLAIAAGLAGALVVNALRRRGA